VTHYLTAARSIGSDDAAKVNAEMRRLPLDRFGRQASIEVNGRVVYDLGVYRVKAPHERGAPWDYYARIATVPANVAFRPAAAAGCASANGQ
jgi:branched-chain amino acid transport system substrate-binding protein